METICLFSNPVVIREEGGVHVWKSAVKNKTRNSRGPYIVEVDADDIIKAVLHPGKLKIKVEHITGSLTLEGSLAYGVSHEMDHLMGQYEEHPKFLWDFNYELL